MRIRTVAYAEIVLGFLVFILTMISYLTNYWTHTARVSITFSALGILVMIVGALALRIKAGS